MLDYNTFSKRVFRVIGIDQSSRSIIKTYLTKLSNDFNIPYEKVVDDFNEYNMYVWYMPYELKLMKEDDRV